MSVEAQYVGVKLVLGIQLGDNQPYILKTAVDAIVVPSSALL
jgi:hypothetical protein